jgi:8-oxo-dGDP phosphatase
MTGPEPHHYRVHDRTEHFAGPLFRLVTDLVEMPDGGVAARDYLRHVGAVAVVPYHESSDEVVLVRQYRHPVRGQMWELPAGLIDVAGEPLAQVAVRELAEEADLCCGRLDPLIDIHTSPGCSDERIRIFLARDLTPAAAPHARRHEESELVVGRFPLAVAVQMIFRGELTNATAVAGLFAVAWARQAGRPPLPSGGVAHLQ